MSLWFLQGLSSSSSSTSETNYPSLWSGGVTWEAADAGTGTQAYWQTSRYATPRTGLPDISIAVAGEPVTNTIRSASWQLGRGEWLTASLTPGAASFEVEGGVTFDPMDMVVIGVMSDVTDQHSDALWVGYVDSVRTSKGPTSRVTTSVSCIDIVGRLGQAAVPTGWVVSDFVNRSLETIIEDIGESAGTFTEVVSTPTSDLLAFVSGFEPGETVLEFLNRLEVTSNLNIFLRGDGKLVLVARWYLAPEAAPTTFDLSGTDVPATWTVELTPTSVINDLDANVVGAPSTATLASRETYGKRSYTIPDEADGVAWSVLNDTGILNTPRPLLSAEFPITDLGQAALFLDPADWVTLDGETYQVLSVQHSTTPGREWRVSVTGDNTQVALYEAIP